MKSLTICISLTVDSDFASITQDFESLYQSSLKKIGSFLYAHRECRLALHFSGVQIDWLVKKHPEYIQILRELISRKQIELLGGGYHNPVFPLLFSQDRSGQIECMTSSLTHAFGKRPRGMTLYGSVWDASLIPCFQTCGMEYVLLDASLLPQEKRCFLPLIASEQGKSIKILPVSEDMLPGADFDDAQRYLLHLKTVADEAQTEASVIKKRVITLNFSLSAFVSLIENGQLAALYEAVGSFADDELAIRLPIEFLHKTEDILPVYVNAGLKADIAKWARVPYEIADNTSGFPITIYDFLASYPRNRSLYNRILYISALISQTHGDKVRRQAAREKLWEAQGAQALVCNPDGIFATNAQRQNAYRILTEAEKLLRECGDGKSHDFKESVTCYDYDGDGHNEYVCRMAQYTACVAQKAGSVTEFDVMHNTGNYADNLKRIERFDAVSDCYERGIFVDHLLTQQEYQEYKSAKPAGTGIFSSVLYRELDFDSPRHEIKLKAESEFSSERLPVSLRKRYIANSNGFTLQYILRNEGPLPLKGVFVVESNFAQTDFSEADYNGYQVAVISQGQRFALDARTEPGTLSSCSFMQITDCAHDISFVYEPNENADVTCMPLLFHRPKLGSAQPQVAGTTFVASLCWNVELSAGMEMEKTISFTVLVPKKRRKSQKNS
mgnify:CR=1 FL=1